MFFCYWCHISPRDTFSHLSYLTFSELFCGRYQIAVCSVEMLIKLRMQWLVSSPDVAQPRSALPVGGSHWDSVKSVVSHTNSQLGPQEAVTYIPYSILTEGLHVRALSPSVITLQVCADSFNLPTQVIPLCCASVCLITHSVLWEKCHCRPKTWMQAESRPSQNKGCSHGLLGQQFPSLIYPLCLWRLYSHGFILLPVGGKKKD